jgi:hypothetical protein
VVNQGEIIEQVAGGVTPIFKDIHFKLEPEWVAVVLLALVYDGQISLSLTGDDRLIDAGNIDRAATQAMDTLADFRFYRRPRSLPLPVWTQIFDAFGLQSALLRSEQDKDREQAVAMLRQHVLTELNQVVEWLSKVQAGLSLWNTSLFTDRFAFTANTAGQVLDADLPTETLSQTALLPYLRKTKDFLEQLSRFDKPGKLRNLTLTTSDAETALADRRVALRARDVLEVVTQLQPLTSYLSEAGAVLPEDHTWLAKAQSARDALLDEARRMAKGEGAVDVLAWRRRLDNLRQEYVQAYTELHTRYVLGPSDDDRRARMLRGPKVEQLKALASVDILSRQELDRLAKLVSDIPTCRNFHADLLVDRPTCPQCNFRPPRTAGPTAAVALDALAGRLDTLLNQWHAALRQNLQSETARSSLAAMTATERQPIDTYLTSAAPADAVLPQGLVKAANQALRGLKTLPVSAERLVEALLVGGMPCTADELEQRLQSFLRRAMSGHDRGNTRLTIEQE